MPLRLVTIPVSHYCEKARWALDRAELRYTEDGHAPLFHRAFTLLGGGTSTPLLVTPHGSLKDSTDILRFADRRLDLAFRLFPEGQLGDEVERLEDHFDRKLGPATRALAYAYLMPDSEAFVRAVSREVPALEALAVRVLHRPWIAVMKKGLGFKHGTGAWANERVRTIFSEVDARLADGRPYLCGDRFTAADLTFAALADPVVDRDDDPRTRFRTDQAPEGLAGVRRELRKTAAGEFVARLYRDERRATPGRMPATG